MSIPTTLLVSCWDGGVHVFSGSDRRHELAGRAVRHLARGPHGGVLGIVDGDSLCGRAATGEWTVLGKSEVPLACAVFDGAHIYVGTDDARVLRLSDAGVLVPLGSFDAVDGRASWFAGGAWIDGAWMGPPLGVRSLTATADGATLLANVHVGGIPRSSDAGATWHATIAVECDVHQVLAHPTDPDLVVAATAQGLGVSRDRGQTWTIETNGLAAPYCSAVTFVGEDLLVSASADHFAADGFVYRRRIASSGALKPVDAGFPSSTHGIVDTGCMDAHRRSVAIADRGGNLYASTEGGDAWSLRASGLASPSSVVVI
ncbi:MAG: hypothetical protein IT353_18465 [Gemmatimonadaceae bacterium]|nr:hypothetical protein [Gemmatimonadaceae bacterium]